MAKPFTRRILFEEHDHFGKFIQDPAGWAIVAALVAQVWEAIICFPKEVEYLWRGKVGGVKVLYGCSRYLMLLCQVANQVLSARLFDYAPISQVLCQEAFISQAVFIQLGIFFMEAVMMLRVFALYNQNPRIKWFLSGIFATSIGLELYGSGNFIRMTCAFGCTPQGMKNVSIYYFCAGAILGQTVLVVAMLIGLILRHRSGKSRTPLVTMLLNQGLATFILVFSLICSMIISNLFPDLVEGMHNGYAVLIWYNAFLSIGTCRLLLQMWKLGTAEATPNDPCGDDFERSGSIVLTSVILESQHPTAGTMSPANAPTISSTPRAQSK